MSIIINEMLTNNDYIIISAIIMRIINVNEDYDNNDVNINVDNVAIINCS